MKRVAIKSICLLFALAIFASTNLFSAPGDPVPGIDIKLVSSTGKEYNVKTNRDGSFKVEKLPKGTYEVKARCADGTCTSVVSPRDVATGQASGKRSSTGAGSGKVSMSDLSFSCAVVSPRDAASGLPTGKRMHKPYTITKEFMTYEKIVIENDLDCYVGTVTIVK